MADNKHIEITKEEARGKCLTCRRAVFYLGAFPFGIVWCIHPKNKNGYTLHSSLHSCEGWEITPLFKNMQRKMIIERDDKYINPYIDKNGKVMKNVNSR
jgi:hypothetical protein